MQVGARPVPPGGSGGIARTAPGARTATRPWASAAEGGWQGGQGGTRMQWAWIDTLLSRQCLILGIDNYNPAPMTQVLQEMFQFISFLI